MELKGFIPRDYQIEISNTCKDENTLVCIPTGTGKTKIALMVAIEQLNKYKHSQVLVLTPTKPLANQISEEFKKHTDIKKVELLTGQTKPKERIEKWVKAQVIIATPQTITSDLENNRIDLENISLLIIDEAHRTSGAYSYVGVSEIYLKTAQHKKILALTASPGSEKSRINNIRDILQINAIEIRTDEDLKEHVQVKNEIWIKLELPEELKKIDSLIKEVYKEKLQKLEEYGTYKPTKYMNKRDLIKTQIYLRKQIQSKNPKAFYGISLTAQLLKLSHIKELIETQGVEQAEEFIEKLKSEKTKASELILNNEKIKEAINLMKKLKEENIKHPKLKKLTEIIKEELNLNNKSRIIVFANFRNTIEIIIKKLKEENIACMKFVGQSNKKERGLNQKEQINILNKFKLGDFNILVASSVAEEGIDIVETTAVIFYEATPSELRKIQRSGRTARTQPGKIIHLITKDTIDESYYWAAKSKEKKMKNTLYEMKKDKNNTISDFND